MRNTKNQTKYLEVFTNFTTKIYHFKSLKSALKKKEELKRFGKQYPNAEITLKVCEGEYANCP